LDKASSFFVGAPARRSTSSLADRCCPLTVPRGSLYNTRTARRQTYLHCSVRLPLIPPLPRRARDPGSTCGVRYATKVTSIPRHSQQYHTSYKRWRTTSIALASISSCSQHRLKWHVTAAAFRCRQVWLTIIIGRLSVSPTLAGAAAVGPWDTTRCRSILAAVAVAKSQFDTAELLIEIDDGDASEVLRWYLSR
jgi:hypothetical protein